MTIDLTLHGPPGFFVEWIRPLASLNTTPLYGITMVLTGGCQQEFPQTSQRVFMAASGLVIGQLPSRTHQKFP